MLLNTVELVAIADNTKNYLLTALSLQHITTILLASLLVLFLYKVLTFNNYVLVRFLLLVLKPKTQIIFSLALSKRSVCFSAFSARPAPAA